MASSELPDTIGRYRIEGVIGRGAMGVVYKGHDPDIDRPVAVKLVLGDLQDGAERDDYLARFRREAQAAGRCPHPNIVAVYDYALHGGNPFIAMEYVEGRSLAARLAEANPLAPAEAVAIIEQILAALGAAHRLGIVHRDIKPANILLTRDHTAKITDFGIARVDRSDLTRSGTMLGTLSYMAPEQCSGGEVDGRSDLFSVAGILHEMLFGQRPFPGRSEAEVITRLLNAPPAGLATPPAHVPPALVEIVRRGLEKLPAARFGSAEEMAAALRGTVAGGPDAAVQDHTIVAPRRPVSPAPVSLAETHAEGFPPELLATIERQLTSYVGPIAGLLVQSAARRAPTVEALCASLAKGIDQDQARSSFMRAVSSLAQTGIRTTGGTAELSSQQSGLRAPIAPELVAIAERELARALGPIASVLVRRTLQAATSSEDLWAKLAAHIDTEREREAFLRTRP